VAGRPAELLARSGAQSICRAHDDYRRAFAAITRRAKKRFETQDWHGLQADSVERLDVRVSIVNRAVAEARNCLGGQILDKAIWAAMKAEFAALIAGRDDVLLAMTFFNSVTRIIFTTVGVDTAIEFVDADFAQRPRPQSRPLYRRYRRAASTPELIRRILLDYKFKIPFRDVDHDSVLAAAEVNHALPPGWGAGRADVVEMLRPIFFRNKGAYLIGRIGTESGYIPLVLALLNNGKGLAVDAALLTQDEASIVFSFTRSYFHVAMNRPTELIEFLHSIMPLKRVAELYISIGAHKHGKTELYRDFMRHLAQSVERFESTPGDKGMVMTVFHLPSYDVVFKVIKDKFVYPKTTTRTEVMAKYALVFKHDRAGRLVDAQEFEHLQFEKSRFAPELLAELMETAAGSVTVDGDHVAIKHLYTERRLSPLNLYIRHVDPAAARQAVVDYGQAIKDLAATNVFPGDLLTKNFGVTRHGRVVFYDYDELCLVTDLNFREMPRGGEDTFDGEPSFYVGPNDIFPEEILPFLGFPPDLRAWFIRHHGELLAAKFWTEMQQRHRAGEVMDIFPYALSRQLMRRATRVL
jgi:isocitrate dehydrogenase kinase/phosphatase